VNSRDEFVRQVAKAITDAQSDPDRKESFIFGLSAKWGEGKTTFIDELEGKLGKDWVRIDINPWKFSDNKITFLQAFLIELISKSNGCKVKKTDILQTKNETTLSWNKRAASLWVAVAVYLAFTTLISILAIAPLHHGKILLSGGSATVIQAGITLVLGTVLIPLLSRTATATVADRITTTLIEFDGKLKTILDSYGDKKLLIVVDDLDRVSAESAITVLDHLRTFFDQKKFCFIVSGDHSVMERYIGSELLKRGESEDQLEEGRRYLKKIFNIYWRLPIPTDAEIKDYISEIIDIKLSDFGLSGLEIKQLEALLNELFENNYRNIERMVSQIAFTLQIVRGKLSACDAGEETKIYYEDLLRYKLLLIKVLLIQELANPYYEYLLTESDSLRISDKRQKIYPEKQKDEKDEYIIKPIMTDGQREDLQSLIESEPRFHDDNGLLVVYDMKPFIYLAADSNFGDHRGLTPSEFHAKLSETLSDNNDFRQLLERHSLEMLQKGITAMITERNKAMKNKPTPDQDREMVQELVSLAHRLVELSDDFVSQKLEFKAYFDPGTIAQYANLEFSEYADLLFTLGDLYQGDADYGDNMIANTDKITITLYLQLIEFAEDRVINNMYERILWGCFDNLGPQNFQSIIAPFGTILDKLGNHNCPDDVLNILTNYIQNHYVDTTGVTAAKVLKKTINTLYIEDTVRKMQALLPRQQVPLVEILKILDPKNYEEYVLLFASEAANYQELCKRIQFAVSSGVDGDALWQKTIDTKLDMLIANITQPVPKPQPPFPQGKQVKQLAQKVIRFARDESQNSLLTSISPNTFLFTNIAGIRWDKSIITYLYALKESGDETNSENAKRLIGLGEQGD